MSKGVEVVASETHEIATFGAGCFWCLDAIARRIEGVVSSTTGYAGGTGPAPSYFDLHYSARSGGGYIEAVQIVFDSSVLTYSDLLDIFFQSHDPTTPDQDGANFGPEYHSTIFYHSTSQEEVARNAIKTLEAELAKPVVTSLKEYTNFYEAEMEHQDFYNQNTYQPYCRVVIHPKLRKMKLD